jgi:hypothetical protein
VSRICAVFRPYWVKAGLVGLGQAHLADGRGGLQFVHGVRAAVQPRRCMPAAMAPLETSSTSRPGAQRGDLPRQFGEVVDGEAGAVVGDQRAADLDDSRRAWLIFCSHDSVLVRSAFRPTSAPSVSG